MEGKLPQLRAELAGLRQRKRELQQELFDIRAAAETRRKKIEDISELRPVAAINHLPVEVLVPIFQYALSMTGYSRWRQHCIQKQLFAAVSRWWRDIVMNTPSLWTTICVYPTWPSSSVKTHVARSHEYPLDIAFLKQWRKSEGSASLRSVLSCTSRWRSLTIRSKACTQSLLCDLSRVSFPCLKRVHIEGDEDFDVEFPVPDNTPALEQLVLKDSRPGFTLLPSLEKLTMLVLYGGINHLQLGPQSIHLPLLRSLTIDVDRPSMLLQAIVVPGLSHFEASLRDIPSLFDGIPLVFNEVHHLCLRAPTIHSVAEVCQAFPNIRHFEVGKLASRFFHGLQENTDLWGDLECVTFRSLHVKLLEETVTEFREWLQQRRPTVKPLHLRLTRIKRRMNWTKTGHLLSMLYNSLHEHCTFEIDRFPLVLRARVTLLDHTLRMGLPHVPPCVVNMHLGQDIPWRKSMNCFRNASADESSDSEEDEEDSDDSGDEGSDWSGDSYVDYWYDVQNGAGGMSDAFWLS